MLSVALRCYIMLCLRDENSAGWQIAGRLLCLLGCAEICLSLCLMRREYKVREFGAVDKHTSNTKHAQHFILMIGIGDDPRTACAHGFNTQVKYD